jgi:hypothetical protein
MINYESCECCKQITFLTDLYQEVESDMLCNECFNETACECYECNEKFYRENCNEIEGKFYCESCYNDNFVTCENCNEIINIDDSLYSELMEKTLCESCFNDSHITCNYCNKVILSSEAQEGCCDECFNENYFICDNCGEAIHSDYLYYHERSERYLCESCYPNRNDDIHDYGYKPSPIFHGNKGEFYGIELETDKYNDIDNAAEELCELSNNENDFYLKEDGSLNNGIEIVFHPRNINSWINYQDDLQLICKEVTNNGGKSFNTDTCGIHIHRSKKDISEITTAKLLWFFSICKNQIVKIAQRNSQYASFVLSENLSGNGIKYIYKGLKKDDHKMERYSAINFQNRHTIEFRIFKGTLKIDTIYAYLGFSHYVVEFCKVNLMNELILDNKELWENFVFFVNSRTKKEKLADILINYLDKKKLL